MSIQGYSAKTFSGHIVMAKYLIAWLLGVPAIVLLIIYLL